MPVGQSSEHKRAIVQGKNTSWDEPINKNNLFHYGLDFHQLMIRVGIIINIINYNANIIMKIKHINVLK